MSQDLAKTLPPLVRPVRKTQFLREMAKETSPPVDSVEDVANYLYLYRSKHHKELILHRHAKAEEVRRSQESFSRHAHTYLFNRRCLTALSDLGGRLSTTNVDRETMHIDMEDRMKKFDTAVAQRLEKMRQRHDAEWAKHMRQQPVQTPAKFRRRSPELMELCRTERKLFLLSRFDESEALRKEIERREKQESKEANDQAMNHWNEVGKQLRQQFQFLLTTF